MHREGRLRLLARCGAMTVGWLMLGDAMRTRCALGRSGIRARKREGDGATPVGRYRLERILYRADGKIRPRTGLPVSAIRPMDGWCDAVGDRNYNRQVGHPYPASAEHLWRDDHVYDIVVIVAHNRRPRVQGHGSAIFIHLARPGFTPTAGCIALERPALERMLARLRPGATIDFTPAMRPVR